MTLLLPTLLKKPKRNVRGETWFAPRALETFDATHHVLHEVHRVKLYGRNTG